MGAFLVASFVLAVTPGPGVTFVVARSLERGRAAGLASVLGVALGNLGNGIGAAVGLALLFRSAPALYEVVRIAGAAYLGWLGLAALRAAPATTEARSTATKARLVRDGFVVALLNPKTALFFAAFLPRFVGPSPSVAVSAGLAATFVVVAATTDTGYALAAASIAPRLTTPRAGTLLRWGPAAVYFALAVYAALA